MRIAERVKVAGPVFPGQNVIGVVFDMARTERRGCLNADYLHDMNLIVGKQCLGQHRNRETCMVIVPPVAKLGLADAGITAKR